MKFTELVDELTLEIWPEGVAENLINPVKKNFAAAAVHLQRYIPCFQDKNINRFPQCSTYYQKGMTVFDAPKGRIDRVYTILSGDEDYPAPFRQARKHDVECHALAFIRSIYPPQNAGMETLPLGFKYPEEDSDYTVSVNGITVTKKTTKHARAVTGLWAIDRNKIWISPWLNSDEVGVIEWNGLKQNYGDEDIVYDSTDWKRAVRLFVHKEFARDFDSDYDKYKFLTVEFNEALGDLLYECKKETEVKPFLYCDEAFDILTARRDAHVKAGTSTEIAATTSYVFAQIGDYGASADSSAGAYDGTNAGLVAAMVKGWDPEFIITTGDNSYDTDGGDMDTGENYYDANVGQHYSDFIAPFTTAQSSVYTSTATKNKFFPAIGNHDYVNATSLDAFLSYFSLPNNERYYNFRRGAVHFFCINSGINSLNAAVEADAGIVASPGSNQIDSVTHLHRGEDSGMGGIIGDWITDSDALWKVVYFHHSPYSSDTTHKPGQVEMQWDFPGMGADVVITGHSHNYERLKDENNANFPYIVNGAGGAPLRGFATSPALASGITSVLRYSAKFGALKGTVSGDTLKLEFYDVDGAVQDTLTLTKPRFSNVTTYS
jgi:hypothetical protein